MSGDSIRLEEEISRVEGKISWRSGGGLDGGQSRVKSERPVVGKCCAGKLNIDGSHKSHTGRKRRI